MRYYNDPEPKAIRHNLGSIKPINHFKEQLSHHIGGNDLQNSFMR